MPAVKNVREFFDPHPGFGGAMIPLPKPFKTIADSLAGEKMTVKEAVEKFNEVTREIGGEIEAREDSIALHYPHQWNLKTTVPCHCWRLIRHRSPTPR